VSELERWWVEEFEGKTVLTHHCDDHRVSTAYLRRFHEAQLGDWHCGECDEEAPPEIQDMALFCKPVPMYRFVRLAEEYWR
jgi:hypothetical protein